MKDAETADRAMERVRGALEPIGEVLPEVENLYTELHRHPELSLQETQTAARVASRLRDFGYEVTEGVGGTGVVGMLRNGDGPTVMLRGDMDALPVEEQTGLPYASEVTAEDSGGKSTSVMHACGHDAHTSCLVGVADLLSRGRDSWRGTVMAVAQPAEEIFAGAKNMLEDGLFTRFARPDVVLGQHVLPFEAGTLAHREGAAMAAAVTLGVRVFGTGGHGSTPQAAVDPVVIAGHIITRLQTIVSREVAPTAPAVVTVGTLHAGTRANIIPDEAYMEINVRSFDDAVQKRILEAIERIVRAEAEAGRSPREPEIRTTDSTPVTYNEPRSTKLLREAHREYFGEERLLEFPALMGSEDFAHYGRAVHYEAPDVPCVYWGVGMTEAKTWREAEGETTEEKISSVPFNHSPFFAPDREPTLSTCLEAMTVGALAFLD